MRMRGIESARGTRDVTTKGAHSAHPPSANNPLEKPADKATSKLARNEEGQNGAGFANLLTDCLACGIVIINNRQQIVALEGEAKRILGLNACQTLPQPLKVLPAALARIVRSSLSSGKLIATRQLEMKAANGQLFTLGITVVPMPQGRKASDVALVIRDVTSVKQLEQDMRRLDRLATIGTLSASMAHEIKNALVAGKTFIDLLLEKHQDAELADVVRREMNRIDSIVSQMLRFAGPAKPTFSAIRLHEILDHSLRMVESQLEGKSIRLTRTFQAASDLVKGDDYQLQQAFVNLFLNALEAMTPNGMLSVVTENISAQAAAASFRDDLESGVRVTINDTGPGIAPENLARLFEPFFTTKPSGTGLGLPITRRIVEEHGGTIQVESLLQKGTTFDISLPAFIKGQWQSSRTQAASPKEIPGSKSQFR